MKQALKKTALALACAGGMAATMQAEAANWLMLQGTEPEAAAGRAYVWGFIQPTYLKTSDKPLAAGPYAGQESQFETFQPGLASGKTFQIMRADIGVRGTGFPLDPNVNYFILAEFGNNGITGPGGGSNSAKLTDASVTLNHFKEVVRVRVGQMKVPGSEELFQAIATFNYINQTNLANMQLVERSTWTDGVTSCNPNTSGALYQRFCNGDSDIQFRGGVNAVRDTGIELFNSFESGGWDTSYAFLFGNGGINKDNREDEFDKTIYLSTEKVFGGEGPRREGMKFYVWQTKGKRAYYDSSLLNSGAALSLAASEKMADRNLRGIGLTYLRGPFRAAAEKIRLDGMIMNGTTGGATIGAVNNAGTQVSQLQTMPNGQGDGGYLDLGYRVLPNLELDVRYDIYHRLTNDGDATGVGAGVISKNDQRDYKTITYGMQYFFNKKSKLMLNFEKRTAESPNEASTANSNKILKDMSNRVSAQVTAVF